MTARLCSAVAGDIIINAIYTAALQSLLYSAARGHIYRCGFRPPTSPYTGACDSQCNRGAARTRVYFTQKIWFLKSSTGHFLQRPSTRNSFCPHFRPTRTPAVPGQGLNYKMTATVPTGQLGPKFNISGLDICGCIVPRQNMIQNNSGLVQFLRYIVCTGLLLGQIYGSLFRTLQLSTAKWKLNF